MIDKYEATRRLVKAATGEEYGDGEMVTDMGTGIAEPGYGDDKTIWVTGDWNPKRFNGHEVPLTNDESRPMRLGNALERIGVEILWLDEWTTCSECMQAIRTTHDSYMWTPYYLVDEEGYYCLDCFAENYSDDDSGLRDFNFVDQPEKAVPNHITDNQLISWGWEKYDGTYQNGLHQGMNDNPTAIFNQIKADKPNHEVVFKYATSQFYIEFWAWIKEKEDDES